MKQFSIIAKPYLQSDLWQAAQEVLEVFQVQLEYDEDATQILAQLRSLARTQLFTASLRQATEQLLQGLKKPYQTRQEKQALTKLAVVADALMLWPEQTGGTAIWNQSRHLEALTNDPDYKVQLKHPKPETYTVEIKRNPELRGSCWIASESYWQSFRVNPPENNVLYLFAEFKQYDFVEFIYENQYRAHYKKLAYDDAPLSFPEVESANQNEDLGVFFQEISAQDFELKGKARTAVFYLSALSDEAVFQSYPSIGWLNPLVMTFDIHENDITSDTETRAAQVLELFCKSDLLLALEAHFNPLDSARVHLFKSLFEAQQEQRQARSMLEYLFWGAPEEPVWQSFMLLDQLQGQFLIEGFGRYGFEAEGLPGCYWVAPEDLALNARWLKAHALGLSQHISEYESAQGVAMLPLEMPGFGSFRGHKKVKLAKTKEVTIFDILPDLTLEDHIFDLEEAIEFNLLPVLLKKAQQFLEDIRELYPKANLYMGEGSFRVHMDGQVSFNDLAFLEVFSRTYLSPLSKVLIHLSPIEKEDIWVDVIQSLPYGYMKLFEMLCLAQQGIFLDKRDIEISYDYGWWQDWFQVLFTRPWDVTINYLSNRGFIIRSSLLGQARLGKAAVGNQYNVSDMRI